MVRLFCFPFAGGSASSFFEWRKRCSTWDVRPVEYPGRGTRWNESRPATVEALANDITAEIGPHLTGSYALLGHSLGGIVAFEVTRLLMRRGGVLPARLCLSAIRAPQLPPREKIHCLPEKEFLSELMRYGGMPTEVLEDEELLPLVLPIVRDDFALYEEYSFRVDDPLPVPISVFGGLSDQAVPIGDLLAWGQHTTKSFQCHFYGGGHFFLFDAELPVIDDLQRDIEESTMPNAREPERRVTGV
jgi:medium-chain acyl-[acyl-carrier-protein] hydrolase